MNILKAKTEKRKIGDIGERIAAKFLKKCGYKILEKNYVHGESEVDIICRRGDIIAFVEVKTRTTASSVYEPRPASSVTPDKQRKIIRAATHYNYRHGEGYKLRLDIVEVYLDGANMKRANEIRHIINAFSKDSAYSAGR